MQGNSAEKKLKRDHEGVAAVLAVMPILYIAWLLSWFGTFATTCAGGVPDSLGSGMVLSALFYGAGMFCLHRSDLGVAGLLLALPLSFLLLWQAVWAADLLIEANLFGRSACTLMMGEDFGEAKSEWSERIYSLYYFMVSVGSLWALAYSHWQFRRRKH